jgi:DNA helicase-2/ATP-dependent DNA helicase PcrA
MPSRFIDELPEEHVEVSEGPRATAYGAYNSYGASRFEERHDPFGGTYSTPGWQRAVANKARMSDGRSAFSSGPADRGRERGAGAVIEGQLVAKSVTSGSAFAVGERVFHQKFGYGDVTALDGNKATVVFDKAGEKRVLDSFLERH